MLQNLRKDLRKLSNKKKAVLFQRFFKTGVGEYGFGDIFLGITVPQSRSIAIKYKDLEFVNITELLKSKMHEERLIALLILVYKFEKQPLEQRRIYDFYLKHTKFINNWDLVDLSSHKIIGEYLKDKPKEVLGKLSKSKSIWERRIAVIATFSFIRENHFKESLKLAQNLIEDKEDLIQKAVGWMLREVGKKDRKTEEEFLNKYYKKMGRTALRYAIEKFPETLRKKYLLGKI